jgi:hypothetical protein
MQLVVSSAGRFYLVDHSLPLLLGKVDVEISVCWNQSQYLGIIDVNDLMWFGCIKGFRLFIDVLDLALLDLDDHDVGCQDDGRRMFD